MKCAVYRNVREWEGGLFYLPEKNHNKLIKKINKNSIFKGIFEFDENFLNNVIGEGVCELFIDEQQYWDGTWSV